MAAKPEKNHSEALDKINHYSTEQFDKNTLFIASGALGVSFAFIKDVVPDFAHAVEKDKLIWSWYIFAGVIFLSLLTHFISMLACSWAIRNEHLKSKEFNSKIGWWNWPIRLLNISMIISILVGAIYLIYFIQQNLV